MPHRLRRVIGINLRAPRSQEGASGLIVELDTRGAVMALGANGVGKTSFLRLIPIFYGAQPSRILRGSGHTAMMRHMLPHPSSCVVFEYERETEQDLRCAVVHCHPDEDKPQFHIIKSGFDERFFSRQEGATWVLLNRDQFKAQAESLGAVVTQAMTPSEYRCVILADKAETKDMVKFRRLAVEHSLGPVSLKGLDRIAEAMGPEALSFDSLQEIVIRQIEAHLGADGKSMRELKKPAKDVVSWLAHHEHLAHVQSKAADAVELSKACAQIQLNHSELSQMRGAVEALIEQTEIAIGGAQAKHSRLHEQGEQRQQELSDEASRASQTAQDLGASASDLQRSVREIESQQTHYATMDIERLEAEQAGEAEMLETKADAEREKARLDSQQQGIVQSFERREREIKEGLSASLRRIEQDRAAIAKDATKRLDTLQREQREAEQALASPRRLQDIPGELQELACNKGALEAELKNPTPSSETQAAVQRIREELRTARQASNHSRQALEQSQAAARQAETLREKQLRAHEAAHADTEARSSHLRALEGQLTPKPGSLREYLHKENPPDLRTVAKVIAPELLDRSDLRPAHDPDAGHTDAGVAQIGALVLQVGMVDAPAWLDEAELRGQIEVASSAVKEAQAEEARREGEVRRATDAAREAAAREAAAQASYNAHTAEVQRLEALEQEHLNLAEEEAQARKQEIADELAAVRASIGRIEVEQEELQQQIVSQKRALEADFDARREEAREDSAKQEARLDTEERDACARNTESLSALASEKSRELTAAGVDAELLASLGQQIEQLDERLRGISRNRHHVDGWRAFRDGPLGTLETLRAMHAQARVAYQDAQRRQREAQDALERHAKLLREELDAVQAELRGHRETKQDLHSLLDRELLTIEAPAGAHRVANWRAADLMEAVGRKRSELSQAVQTASSYIRGIRMAMQRTEGPASEWLARKEAETPVVDGIANHLDTLRRGRMLGEWYSTDYTSAIGSLNNDLNGVLGQARQFVKDMEGFDREIGRFNSELQSEMSKVKRFPSFGDLRVAVRSKVGRLEYMEDLRKMKELADSRVSHSRMPGAAAARELHLPSAEEVSLMKRLRDLLQREGGIRASLGELVSLECSLKINDRERTISREDEFKKYASTGNTGMIVAMFLMGFASMVRKDAGGAVRMTWITDEIGRFDASNLQAFLSTLDENAIDVISAAPEASGGSAEMFDRLARFEADGNILTAECEEALHVL